ncbi:SCAN domain-containing protein 3-like [Macrobrachium nipponense]|uniref:SCAN domain-containing protein 3-like n=1 Tax=Macrobrachium nipponense TaxID=159736 RepID=UPI0030C7F999
MQSSPQAQFKWIMLYQCHLTKFVILRPLSSKRAAEVVFQLLDIFLLFGAPAILQSDNGSEFTAHVITELKDLWPDLIIVHGKPRHPQSQGSVERANGDIKDMLIAWMSGNNTQDWSIGLRFVQNMKNSGYHYHSGIQHTPYKAMFGCDPIPSPLTRREREITQERKRAREAQLSQAERMVKRSRLDSKTGEVGDNVAVHIPLVDRGRVGARNILGVIVDRDENDLYTIAVKSGIIKTKYSRNQFDLRPQKLLTQSDVKQDEQVSLRQALKSTATCGQGFLQCGCGKGEKNCSTNRVIVTRLSASVTVDVITV